MQTSTQSQTPAQPQAPAAPVAAPGSPVAITTVGADGQARTFRIPTTRAEYRELLTQREEISDQLINVTSRRREIASEIVQTEDAGIRTGLQDRLRLLDDRIVQLETDLAMTGRQLASAPGEVMTASISQQQGVGSDFEEGLLIGGFFVLFFMGAAFWWMGRRWKKLMARPAGQLGNDATQRFERLEQGMDAIAIEIERVSEGQRFVTRLLSEAHSPAVPNAQRLGEPVPANPDSPRRR